MSTKKSLPQQSKRGGGRASVENSFEDETNMKKLLEK